jgi:hypothetical protein
LIVVQEGEENASKNPFDLNSLFLNKFRSNYFTFAQTFDIGKIPKIPLI